MNKASKERYERYITEGRCRRCPLPPIADKIHCETHGKEAQKTTKTAMKRFIQKRRDAQQCVTCGDPSTTYNCPKCRRKITRRTRKRRAVP